MTQSNQPNDRDLFTRIVQLEYRLTRIENSQTQLENTMTPGGYITEAFDRVLDEIDERFNELNGKIDIIMRGITGIGNS
jgi:hypothetical protein